MTQEHFVAIAEALHNAKPVIGPIAGYHEDAFTIWQDTCDRVADALASQSPAFDRQRFIEYANNGPAKKNGR